MGLSSNILWHQTNEEGFHAILKSKKLLYSYSLERIVPVKGMKPFAFPMISVSDYPISEISNNDWRYGSYCIGFRQEWGIKVGFSPVWYCSYSSHSLRLVDWLLGDAIKNESQGRIGVVMALFANMKLNQAPLQTKKQKFGKYRFYDEHEWRLVPYIAETDKAEVMPFLTEEGYKKYKENHDGNSLLDFGVEFHYDDIHYIIVEKESDVQNTRDIVGDRIHIFTKGEILEDIVGVDHHEEILPSQFEMDYKATQRHLAWVSKTMHERIQEKYGDKVKE